MSLTRSSSQLQETALRGNHCNAPDHQRNDCKAFLAIKAKHDGKLPDGYKGAREIAYEKWRNNQYGRAAKGPDQVKTLAAAASDNADDDSDFSESDLPANGICAALTQPISNEPVKSVHKKSRFAG